MSGHDDHAGTGDRLIEQADNAAVEIYLGEGHRQMRAALRAALRDLRLDVRDDFDETDSLRRALHSGNADMVIVDADLPGGDARVLLHEIRHDELGPNPFVPVIVTTWKNSPERIRELIDSGVDGLLVKPVSISAIRMQVDAIIHRRKPFVVTSSYIGPDRRRDTGRQDGASLIEVPNTLRAKVKGDPIEPAALRREIAAVRERVTSERLRRNAFELSFLTELIRAEDHAGGNVARVRRFLRRFQTVIDDTTGRIADTPQAHNTEICRSALRVANTIAADFPDHSSRDMAQLKPLSDAILLSFNPERSAADMAREIAGSIAGFRAREAAPGARRGDGPDGV